MSSLIKEKTRMIGPQVQECDDVHAAKHRGENESYREAMNRIAAALQDSHEHYKAFREILLAMKFLAAGRVQSAIGSLKNITPFNCFVSPTIEDSFVSGLNSIMDVAKQAAATMREGGGIGFDFSTLRPSGDMIMGVGAPTSGPLAFAPIFNAICDATTSAGGRRGAMMLVLRVDHPDIEAFIRAKHNENKLRGFNLSVAVTDEFMECLINQKPFPLQFNGKVYREVDPNALWELIMRSNYDWAEPGVLFIDTINRMNNLYYCETLAATNPCGEQPLPPDGACLLGSTNLVKYLKKDDNGLYYIDVEELAGDIPWIVRSMDNIVDRARYPLLAQKTEAQNKRRLGLGMTGVANALEACGYSYGSPEFIDEWLKIGNRFTRECYLASIELAKEKGAFPLFDAEKYLQSEFIKTLDDDVQKLIGQYGIRNSHLTSIAPTGSISFGADNISSGVEPVFAYKAKRSIIHLDGTRIVEVDDYGVRFLGIKGKTSAEVTPAEHVAVLTATQSFIDSAVSKTCNVPNDIEWEAFKDIYLQAWEGGVKGCTTYRAGCLREGIMVAINDEEPDDGACVIDPDTNERSCE